MRWKTVLALLVTALPLTLRAQDHAVFDREDVWKLYTTLQFSLTQAGGADQSLGGIGVGTIMNDQWRLGIDAHTQVDDLTSDNGDLELGTWDYWELGGDVGYIFAPASLVHADVGLFAGAGWFDSGDDSSDFLIVEPSAAVCLNLHETWELGLRAGWRYTDGFSAGALDDGDATELVFSVFARATEF